MLASGGIIVFLLSLSFLMIDHLMVKETGLIFFSFFFVCLDLDLDRIYVV